ncbi:hypothetical protein HPB51_022859 [Rhipicephalus microplus]|uniref:Uncharacterized protein n=1 Tax=Rhipicephalus microplus TaxID=6941 RepID=A0A9J6DQ87_RHIMP|nr:hypothetical protein HPB51_022859 [Rhipicephalus microplus]
MNVRHRALWTRLASRSLSTHALTIRLQQRRLVIREVAYRLFGPPDIAGVQVERLLRPVIPPAEQRASTEELRRGINVLGVTRLFLHERADLGSMTGRLHQKRESKFNLHTDRVPETASMQKRKHAPFRVFLESLTAALGYFGRKARGTRDPKVAGLVEANWWRTEYTVRCHYT